MYCIVNSNIKDFPPFCFFFFQPGYNISVKGPSQSNSQKKIVFELEIKVFLWKLYIDMIILKKKKMSCIDRINLLNPLININTSIVVPGALSHCLQHRTTCNAAPPARSKMANRGPQNGRRGLERGPIRKSYGDSDVTRTRLECKMFSLERLCPSY